MNADDVLTWDEYSSIQIESLLVKHSDPIKKKEEFILHIDRNKDGRVDKREILVKPHSHHYYKPKMNC